MDFNGLGVGESKSYGALIGSEWIKTPKQFTITNPATGEALAQVADCTVQDAQVAADAAVRAFAQWSKSTAYERSLILQRWYGLILQNEEMLARIMSLEMGKPIVEARGEVRYAAGFVSWYAEEAKRIYGEMVPSQFAHKRLWVLREPVGPVVAVTPWNFPAAMITRKAAPGLAAGCTVIAKPAEQSPLSALALAQLWQEAGGPPGTLQVLTTNDPAPLVSALLSDARIKKLTFTGSTEIGRILYTQAAKTIKHVSLELGGHAPFIIFEDADIGAAVSEVIASKFRNAGQTCVCANRIYVHRSISDQFSQLLAEKTQALRVGDPLSEQTQVGPLVDMQGLRKVQAHVADAIAKGATLLTGGQAGEGLYFQPTVLTNVSSDMQIMSEETFGPVAPIIPFDQDEEAVAAANNTPFGLAAYIWTRDLGRSIRVAEALQYGIVGVNDGVPSTVQAPFGGYKDSGIGREGGKWGLEEFLELKYISLGLPKA